MRCIVALLDTCARSIIGMTAKDKSFLTVRLFAYQERTNEMDSLENIGASFLFLLAFVLIAFAIYGVSDIISSLPQGKIVRACSLDGYAWYHVEDDDVFCVNYTSEPQIVLLGKYCDIVGCIE